MPLLAGIFLFPPASAAGEGKRVLRARYDGAISPAAAEWLGEAIRKANAGAAEALLIELDTPGGLLESTRLLVKEISASSVPVIVYVSPPGARAASAGAFITLAAHVAAMAGGTRIGAAHPVELGREAKGDLREKIENDAAAFIRTIAASRKRNAAWAEAAVRKSSSATEKEALAAGAIDCLARDVPELLSLLDGRKVETAAGSRTLKTRGAALEDFPMSGRVRILKTLADPNIAYILMMVGIYGILYEIVVPGAVFPGVAGGICLILGLYAMQTLPVNYAGAALLLLALLLFAIESQVTSGLLGLGGLIALAAGSLLLVPSEFPGFRISRLLIAAVLAGSSAFLLLAAALLLKVRRKKAVSGVESMVGRIASAKTDLKPRGQVILGGEIWNAESEEDVAASEEVEVVKVEDLKLIVRRREPPSRL